MSNPPVKTRITPNGEICGADLMRLPYAVDEDGHVLYWDLASSAATPHFLAVGSAGTGKTNLMRTLIVEGARRGWRLRVCDPKRVELTARAAKGRLSAIGAQRLWGSPAIGVSVPRGEAGRGTSVGVEGSPVECQFY